MKTIESFSKILIQWLIGSLIVLLTVLPINNTQSQISQVDCYNSLNVMDSLLKQKDTIQAIEIFESLNNTSCEITKNRYSYMSKVYFASGLRKKSRELLKLSVEKGMMMAWLYHIDITVFLNDIEEKYGSAFKQEMITLNQDLIKEKYEKYGSIINRLIKTNEEDQLLRKNKKNKQCKLYDYLRRKNLPYDTTLNQQEMMNCIDEFRYLDSSIIHAFFDIVDSLGYVPGDDIVFGIVDLSVLICHTSRYKFKNLEPLYFNSLILGKITPKVYAWYLGYYKDYFNKQNSLYFTHSEKYFDKLSQEEISQINKNRREIGLPSCPTVIWNTSMF